MSEFCVIPNEDEVKKLYKEYGMTEDQVKRDVARVRKWMLSQPHLPVFPESKNNEVNFWIEGLLRLTKNSYEKTIKAVDNNFQLKTLFPEVCSVHDLPDYVESELFEYLTMAMLPRHTPDGLKVLFYSFSEQNPQYFRPTEIYKRIRLILEIYQKKGIDFTGIHVIIELKNLKLSHMGQFDLFHLKSLVKLAQNAYPLRLKHTHLLFPPNFIDVAKNILKPFVSKKMFSRTSFHKDLESLWEQVPRDVLPVEFGGYSGSLDVIKEEWKTLMLKNYDWLMSNANYVSDESKRLKSNKTKSDGFENESFKMLVVD